LSFFFKDLDASCIEAFSLCGGQKLSWNLQFAAKQKEILFGVDHLLTYLQFSIIKWAKQRLGQNPIDFKFDEAIQI
jgi:hypothetical protein